MTEPERSTLDAQAMIAEARRQTGLSDFGNRPAVMEPLSALVDALNREARLSASGLVARRQGLVRALVNRLRIQESLNRHPEIDAERILGPIIVVGLARSGTTKLHRMMAAGETLQYLPLWKMMSPVADLSAPRSASMESAIASAEAAVELMRKLHPLFYAAHPMHAREPDEEVFLMDLTFTGNLHVHGNHVPSYQAWVEGQALDDWYAYLHKLLQYFQWQAGSPTKPWLLKAPFHIGNLPALLKYFPRAVVVHCHRHPMTAMASIGGLMEASRSMYSADVSPREVGRTAMRVWSRLMTRYLRDRPRFEATTRFVDLPYTRIVRDAGGCIAEIHAMAGLEFPTSARNLMREWELRNTQHQFGRHEYSLDRYGITPEEVEVAFREYVHRYKPFLVATVAT